LESTNQARIYDYGLSDPDLLSTAVVQNDVWTHVAGAYNGTNLVLYINGVQDSTAASTVTIGGGGIKQIGNKAGSDYYFNGTIDEVRIYNRALTATDAGGYTTEQKPILSNSIRYLDKPAKIKSKPRTLS